MLQLKSSTGYLLLISAIYNDSTESPIPVELIFGSANPVRQEINYV